MNIHEHQAKEILREFGAPVSNGVVILSIDDIEMVAVIGVPDNLRGEIIKAVIVPRNISYVSTQNNQLKEKIKNHVKNKLAAHEYPRIIEFVSELPMTNTGKIKRNILRENHLKESK